MTSIETLLVRGPDGGDINGGLDQIREAVLSHGITSNSDGMVSIAMAINELHVRLTFSSPIFESMSG